MHFKQYVARVLRRDVINLTVPVVTEQVFTMSMGVVNAIMVGQVGSQAVSAVGMVDSINNIFVAFFVALSLGGTVVVAQYIGHGDREEANDATKQALFSGLILSLFITLVTWLLRRQVIFALYGAAEPAVMKNVNTYFSITLLTYPFIALTSIACGVLRGAGDTRTPMKITILMNAINICLGYILIYGINISNVHFSLSIPALGVKGAAIGLAVARAVGTFMIISVLIKGSKTLRLTQLLDFKFNVSMQKAIFNVGIPASLESLLFNGGKLITQVFIVGMGTASTAANYIASSVFSMVNVPGNALGVAATTLVGQYMGRGEKDEASDTMMYLTRLASFCMLLLCMITYPLAVPLARLYSSSADVVMLAAHLIRLTSMATPPLWPLAFVLPAGLKGAGDTRYTMVTSFLGMWAFRIVLGYVLGVSLKLGVAGVWMGMFTDWLVRGVLYYSRLKKGKWVQNVVIKDIGNVVSHN
ncbi:putative MATE family efflux protein [Caldicoprobacter guelmensis]|uniref:MATE family efflux transporter n=1 Tax=Caldicoprobacter guelmensis TaxID=1170224 RepID=UPI001957E030|nr:MATE family efflux transporter [Caldicoprobacter guelmensis]MBM7581845.1 putative MATE family efflux protein [Caldicoprobacter guelmensis]